MKGLSVRVGFSGVKVLGSRIWVQGLRVSGLYVLA